MCKEKVTEPKLQQLTGKGRRSQRDFSECMTAARPASLLSTSSTFSLSCQRQTGFNTFLQSLIWTRTMFVHLHNNRGFILLARHSRKEVFTRNMHELINWTETSKQFFLRPLEGTIGTSGHTEHKRHFSTNSEVFKVLNLFSSYMNTIFSLHCFNAGRLLTEN